MAMAQNWGAKRNTDFGRFSIAPINFGVHDFRKILLEYSGISISNIDLNLNHWFSHFFYSCRVKAEAAAAPDDKKKEEKKGRVSDV